ncbi:MAG: basic amino acid ABC transporter substrate-binding protein [Christensenellales bacterium]|jgi:ABC-type amino acid transport substrate-binding protein
MNTIKKIGSFILVALLGLTLLAGCGSSSSGGVLRMGTNAAFPPFEYKEGDKVVGLDVDICEKIAEKMGMTLEVVDMEFDSLLPAVNADKCDVVAAGMTVRPDRELQVDFSETYYRSTQVVLVGIHDDSIQTIDDLKGKSIGVQTGTTGEEEANNIEGAEVRSFSNGLEATMALKNDQIDLIIIDAEPAKNFVENNSDAIKIVEIGFADEYYALAVKKGNSELLEKINAALKELKEDGALDSLIASYSK